MEKALMVFICLALFVGCASYGNKQITEQDTVDKIVIGKSTKAEVKEILGEPSEVIFTDSGDEDWVYLYTRSTTRASSFIPIVGLVAGGVDTKTNTLRLRFNKEGVVSRIGKGQAKGGAGSILD